MSIVKQSESDIFVSREKAKEEGLRNSDEKLASQNSFLF